MVAEVVKMRDYTLRDIPSVLRKIADQVESGELPANSCALVVVGDDAIDVCMCGEASTAGDAHMILHAGMIRLADTI